MGSKKPKGTEHEQHYGLPLEQLHWALCLPNDSVDLMHTVAEHDGMHIGHPGSEVAKLIAHGFIEVSRANGHAALAKLTAAGFKALVLRLKLKSFSTARMGTCAASGRQPDDECRIQQKGERHEEAYTSATMDA